jgi:[ribosomal protein S5]-alanine N-acetyltransferase
MNLDPVVMEFFPRILTRVETDAMVQRIEEHFEQYGYGLYALELLSSGEFLGFTGFSHPSFQSRFKPCIEIGWRLKKETWGRGYATEAAEACLRYGFDTWGFDKVLSFTAAVNTRSERVMQKIGMRHSGFFDHPAVEVGHSLRPHVLYEATSANPRHY